MTKKTTATATLKTAAGVVTTGEIELPGMPDPEVMQTIRYAIERATFVDPDGRLDVGDRIGLTSGGELEFEIVKVTHTRKDGRDVYTMSAVEVL